MWLYRESSFHSEMLHLHMLAIPRMLARGQWTVKITSKIARRVLTQFRHSYTLQR
jgi:hypothetical protein